MIRMAIGNVMKTLTLTQRLTLIIFLSSQRNLNGWNIISYLQFWACTHTDRWWINHKKYKSVPCYFTGLRFEIRVTANPYIGLLAHLLHPMMRHFSRGGNAWQQVASSPHNQHTWAHWLKECKSYAMVASHWCALALQISVQSNTCELSKLYHHPNIVFPVLFQAKGGQIINLLASPLDIFITMLAQSHPLDAYNFRYSTWKIFCPFSTDIAHGDFFYFFYSLVLF